MLHIIIEEKSSIACKRFHKGAENQKDENGLISPQKRTSFLQAQAAGRHLAECLFQQQISGFFIAPAVAESAEFAHKFAHKFALVEAPV